MSVTSSPALRATDATSAPMKPAPTTATRGPFASSARMRIESSMVRSVWMPARSGVFGSVRGVAPVAMISASNPTGSPSLRATSRFSRSSASARTPSRRSSPSLSTASGASSSVCSGPHWPASSCFERGGRS